MSGTMKSIISVSLTVFVCILYFILAGIFVDFSLVDQSTTLNQIRVFACLSIPLLVVIRIIDRFWSIASRNL